MKKKATSADKSKRVRDVNYVNLSPENEAWVREQQLVTNQTFTGVIEQVIAAAREGRKVKIEERKPAYIAKAEAAKAKREAALKESLKAVKAKPVVKGKIIPAKKAKSAAQPAKKKLPVRKPPVVKESSPATAELDEMPVPSESVN